jgi:ATP-dependent DNA helicase RecQ
MGVDKKDIKTVVHLEASATAEAYIQEAGRGGRDGSVAKAILLWSLQDSMDYSVYKAGSREAALRDFAETTSCRRQVLLDALGAEQAVCSGCDVCEGIKYEPCDWELAWNLINKNRNFYSKDEAQEEHALRMNEVFRKTLGLNIWNHNDSVETVEQLIKSSRIRIDRFLWKGRLRIEDSKKSLIKRVAPE